jgi:hypothetical protein
MEIKLNKMELQETLREMGVKFTDDSSKVELEKILQKENHCRWINIAKNGAVKFKKKGRFADNQLAEPAEKRLKTRPVEMRLKSPPKKPNQFFRYNEKYAEELESVETCSQSETNKNLNVFDPSKNLEEFALARANGVCDLCQKETDHIDFDGKPSLFPYIFVDPINMERKTVKNAVALCFECLKAVQENCTTNDIKILRRKARCKRIKEIQIEYRR